MNKTIILISIFLIISSCSKEDSLIRTSDMSVPTITGFELRNETGEKTKTIGYPNNKLKDEQSNCYFSFYPNPAKNYGNIHVKTPENNEIKQVWIVQAQYTQKIKTYSIDNGMINYSVGGAPLINKETIDENFLIDLKDLPNGYYRIYVKIGDILLYDNIIIYK